MGENSVALHAHCYIPTVLGHLEKKKVYFMLFGSLDQLQELQKGLNPTFWKGNQADILVTSFFPQYFNS